MYYKVDTLEKKVNKDAMALLLACGFHIFLTSINCRHFMMYSLFVKGGKMGTTSHNPFRNVFYAYWIMFLTVFIVCTFYIVESFVFMVLTRKASNQFVDFHLNIRCFVVFTVAVYTVYSILAAIGTTVQDGAMFSTFSNLYHAIIISGYIMDSFTLPILKVWCRRRGYTLFDDIEFLGQEGYEDDISEICDTKKLYSLLLSLSEKQFCSENVLFIHIVQDLKFRAKRQRADISELLVVYENYIPQNSLNELNLSDSCRCQVHKQIELLRKNKQPNERLSNDIIVRVFDDTLQEVKKHIRQNLLNDFYELEDVKKIMLKQNSSNKDNPDQQQCYNSKDRSKDRSKNSDNQPINKETVVRLKNLGLVSESYVGDCKDERLSTEDWHLSDNDL
eukprot:Pgem_evm1s1532